MGCCFPRVAGILAVNVPFRITSPADRFEMDRVGFVMRHAAIRELYDYWNGLRGSRHAPERADIDLAAIRGLVADLFMLEVDVEHRFPFVLSGTRVNALACNEQKGHSFLDLWSPHEVRNIAAMLLTVLDTSCPVHVAAAARLQGFNDYPIDILFLPLGRRGESRARILGLTAPAPPPSWLGLLPIKNLALCSVQTMDGTVPPGRFEIRNTFDPAPIVAEAQPFGSPSRRVRHLRVFDGGRRATDR
jgi:hypothetical protein